MPETNIFTLISVVIFAAILSWRIPFLRNKTLGVFSLLQILYLVIIPGFIYTFFFAYLQAILKRPIATETFAPDGLLINVTLLSVLYTFGGIAIHSTSKMLAEILRKNPGPARDLNKYFHMSFSHNLTYSGAIATIASITLLEMNHPSPYQINNPVTAFIKGSIMGLSLVAGMYWYTVSDDEYIGRWSELKTSFLVLWLSAAAIIFAIKKTNPVFANYDTLLPTLAAFIVIAPLNAVLVYRRLKRGGFSLYLILGKFKKKLF